MAPYRNQRREMRRDEGEVRFCISRQVLTNDLKSVYRVRCCTLSRGTTLARAINCTVATPSDGEDRFPEHERTNVQSNRSPEGDLELRLAILVSK